MFVCRWIDAHFGVGEIPMEAFEDMLQVIRMKDGFDSVEGIDPNDCEFFEQIEVNIRETKTWDIRPVYEYDE